MNQGRLILAVALSMAVFFAYAKWFAPPPPSSPAPQITATEPPGSAKVDPVQPQPPSSLSSSFLPEYPQMNGRAPDVQLENEYLQARFSSWGGILSNLVLKKYHEKPEDTSPSIDLMGLENGSGFFLTLGTPDSQAFAPYQAGSQTDKEVLFTSISPLWDIKKNFVINSDDPHLIDISVQITNKSSQAVPVDPRLWILRRQKKIEEKKGFFSFLKQPDDYLLPSHFVEGKFEAETRWDKMSAKGEKIGKIYWTSLQDRYFILALVSRLGTNNVSVQYGKEKENTVFTSMSYGSQVLQPGEKMERKFSAYLGPKKRENLKKLGVNLERSVDYGWFGFLANPLLWLLIFFHKMAPNWGLAIILLTFFVKMLLHPINKKSMDSMKAMQALQPKMKEMREKFKNDKEKLNMEVMQLFKAHKVNPMGGCLPLVIQMPVYIALYKVLWNAVELYHAPFIWFYRDLSAPDPYMISPILLGLLMAAQQKLTPQAATMDPAQQKMMTFMPIMFSAFMIFLPAGLVIYISVNTIMSVIQQYMMQKNVSFVSLWKKWRG